ncbi:MAG: hypothetical protein RDV48_17540 [Candidatus Eremiobacteraeota bacterium]|nr:hypothetical protein [Candidatus Eremiobacteraeota bacterium]
MKRTKAPSGGKRPSSSSEIVAQYYPLRKFSPKLFSRKYRMSFFIKPHFFEKEGLRAEIERIVQRPHGGYPNTPFLDVLALITFDEKEIEDLKEQLSDELWKNSEILIGLPHKPAEFEDLIKELNAMEELGADESMKVGMLASFEKEIRRYLTLEEMSWYWKGAEIFPRGEKGKNKFYSSVLSRLFPKMIAFPQRLSPSEKNKIVPKALSMLLDFRRPLVFQKSGGNKANRLLREFLHKNRVSEQVVDYGAYQRYEIEKTLPPDSPLTEYWALLTDTFVGKGTRKQSHLVSLYTTLLSSPFGLSFHNFLLLIGCFIRAHQENLTLCEVSGGSRKEVEITPSRIIDLLKNPENKEITYEHASSAEMALLKDLVALVRESAPGEEVSSSAEAAFSSLAEWASALPPLVRDILENDGGKPAAFIDLLSRKKTRKNAREILWVRLPQLLDLTEFDYRDEISVQEFREKLADLMALIKNALPGRKLFVLEELSALFNAGGALQQEVQKAIGDWYERQGGKLASEALSPDLAALLKAAKDAGASDDLVFSKLPAALALKECASWEKDRFLELILRIGAALQQVPQATPGGLPARSSGEDSRHYAQRIMLHFLEKTGKSLQDKESMLVDLAETLYLGAPR